MEQEQAMPPWPHPSNSPHRSRSPSTSTLPLECVSQLPTATLPLPAGPPASPLQPGRQSEQALRRVRQAQPTVLPPVQWVTSHTQGLPSRVCADFLRALQADGETEAGNSE